MPHSPRWHGGRLWLLESGTGRLVLADIANGRWQAVAELPGFARGLAFAGPYAFTFVGLSKIRPTSAMDGVPLAERRHELKCGVAVVDLRTGQPRQVSGPVFPSRSWNRRSPSTSGEPSCLREDE
jgi:uncharacterized protein (TIGR03032 family)